MTKNKEIITTIVCAIIVSTTSILSAFIAREKITNYEVREIPTGYNLGKVTKYFPLAIGNYWIYTGRQITRNDEQTKEKNVNIKMEVVDCYKNNNNAGVALYIMRGHPLDAADFESASKVGKVIQSKYGFLLIANKIYKIRESRLNEAIERVQSGRTFYVDTSDWEPGTESPVILEECEFEFPLFKGLRYGDNVQLARNDYRYFWYVDDYMNYRYSENGHLREYPQFEIAYLTNPDSLKLTFAPYLGITSYEYSHHGSRMEVNLTLSDYKICD